MYILFLNLFVWIKLELLLLIRLNTLPKNKNVGLRFHKIIDITDYK